jgi:hypothetical protein
MKRLIQLNLLLLLISSAMAEEWSPQQSPTQESQKVLRDYDWKDLAQQQTLPGEVVSTNGSSILKIEITNDTPQDLLLLKISDSAVIKKAFFLLCEASRENVSVTNNYAPRSFADRMNNSIFINVNGLLPPAVLGSDGRIVYAKAIGKYRDFITDSWTPLQFELARDSLEGLPTQLEVHLFTQGARGTVYVRPIRLLGVIGSWWSEEEAPWIGAIGGPIVGCLGGLLGWLSGKGKARSLVLAVWKACIAAGILFLIALFIALATGQPEYVSMPLFVFGIVTTTVFGTIFPTAKKRYDEFEIRRMASVDALES